VTTQDHGNGRRRGAGPSGGSGARNLTLRTLSAAVLAPVVLVLTYADGWLFLALCAVAAGGILWEWIHLIADRGGPRPAGPRAPWAGTPRNAPCPCGSGKKFKHCHGRV